MLVHDLVTLFFILEHPVGPRKRRSRAGSHAVPAIPERGNRLDVAPGPAQCTKADAGKSELMTAGDAAPGRVTSRRSAGGWIVLNALVEEIQR